MHRCGKDSPLFLREDFLGLRQPFKILASDTELDRAATEAKQ
jgi:hypothetical protein